MNKKTLIGKCDIKITLETSYQETISDVSFTEEDIKKICKNKEKIAKTIETQLKEDIGWLGEIKKFNIEIINNKVIFNNKLMEE